MTGRKLQVLIRRFRFGVMGRKPFLGRDTRAPDTVEDSRGAASPQGDHVKKIKTVQCSFKYTSVDIQNSIRQNAL